MIRGSFLVDYDLPMIEVAVSFGQRLLYLPFILDTGFSGDLKIDEQTANDLGVTAPGTGYFTNANGENVLAQTAQGYVDMEERKVPITIIIKNGVSLAGGALFSALGYKVVIDYKNREAYLERIISLRCHTPPSNPRSRSGRCAHVAQRDKAGEHYILRHPCASCSIPSLATDEERITAVLHDVMEDCGLLRVAFLPNISYPERSGGKGDFPVHLNGGDLYVHVLGHG